jgi:GNAT superfamily N-acetyltransferase
MVIRPVAVDDLEPLLSLYRQLNPEDPPLSAGSAAEVWTTILHREHLTVFVGVLADQLIASCTLVLVPNLTRGARPYGLIENVVTDRMHRRRGYGTAILRHALQHAWEAGCYKVMLLTGSQREETLRFYEQAGFERGMKTGFIARSPLG